MVKTTLMDDITDSCCSSHSLNRRLHEERRILLSNGSKSREDRRLSALQFGREHGNRSIELYKRPPPEKRILKSPYLSNFSTSKKERILVQLEPELVGLVTDKVLKAECKVKSLLETLTRDLFDNDLPRPTSSSPSVITKTDRRSSTIKKSKKTKGKQYPLQQKSIFTTSTFESSAILNPPWSPTKQKESIPSLDRLAAPKRVHKQSN